MNLQVEAIPAFRDNYIWAIHNSRDCVLVDPGEAGPPLDFLARRELRLAGLLLTHHHHDHIGGVDAILDRHPAPAWGSNDDRMPARSKAVREGNQAAVPEVGLAFSVLEVPAHTRSHIAFYGHGMLFCGDTLFSVGCGRLFEGTPRQMQASLDKLMELPGDTRFYCGHEYTLANCRFAVEVEPDNKDLRAWMREAERLRAEDRVTLPSTLELERAVNPFLRTRDPAVIAAARRREPLPDERPETVFGVIRRWKDVF